MTRSHFTSESEDCEVDESQKRYIAMFESDTRGVTVAVEYALAVAVIFAFMGVLAVGFSDRVQHSAKEVASVEMERVSEEIATAIEDVEETVNRSEARSSSLGGEFTARATAQSRISVETPSTVAGEPYVIRVNNTHVIVETTLGASTQERITTEFVTTSAVDGISGVPGSNTTVTVSQTEGGPIKVVSNG